MESCPKPPPPELERSSSLEIGLRVEDLWDVQEPLLTPSEKLNSCFDSIPVSDFPQQPSSQVVEIPSNSSVASAVEILSKHKLLSVPVYDIDAPKDSSWIDRYVGMVDFAGIAVWLLHQAELAALEPTSPSSRMGSVEATEVLDTASDCSSPTFASPRSGPEVVISAAGSFFSNLISSDLYQKTAVKDISGSFRWAPFLPLQSSDSFLTMLLLLSKYRMKMLLVVDLGEGKIDNIITQSAAIHMLAECAGLHWFEKWGTKKLSELALPVMKPDQLVKVGLEEPVLKAFKLMRMKGVGGLPVVDKSVQKVVGNMSIRDIQFLLIAPELFEDDRSITVENFLEAVKQYLMDHEEASPLLLGHVITCRKEDTIKDVILKLDTHKIHRIYVVDDEENLEGVVTLRDIISKLVHEPRGYFGDFFDGVVPLPKNSRV